MFTENVPMISFEKRIDYTCLCVQIIIIIIVNISDKQELLLDNIPRIIHKCSVICKLVCHSAPKVQTFN